ncbi:MAG: hypothetical protein K2H50_04955, partial [Paramuribaculum sp.]|nr:hypothetical protein [Paramuribaculum sp.]
MDRHKFAPGVRDCEERVTAVVKQLVDERCTRLPHEGINGGAPLPSHDDVSKIISLSRRLVFPGFFGASGISYHNLEYYAGIAVEELYNCLKVQIAAGLAFGEPGNSQIKDKAREMALEFVEQLPELRRVLFADAQATYVGDP